MNVLYHVTIFFLINLADRCALCNVQYMGPNTINCFEALETSNIQPVDSTFAGCVNTTTCKS